MLLDDEEMTEVFGGACHSTVCDDCTHGCRFIAEAQLKKVVEWGKEICLLKEHSNEERHYKTKEVLYHLHRHRHHAQSTVSPNYRVAYHYMD